MGFMERLRHYGIGPNNGAIPNLDTRQYFGSRAKPYIVADYK